MYKTRLLCRSLVGVLLILVLALVGMVGCDAAPKADAMGIKTTPVATAKACGTIQLGPNGKLVPTGHPQQVGNCFVQALKKCQPTTLIFVQGGLDTVKTHTFALKQQKSCVVTDTVQFRIVPAPPRQSITYTCAQVSSTPSNLRFINCGAEGTVEVPL